MTSEERPLAAAYEAQPIIEAMILAFRRDGTDAVVFSVAEVRKLLERHFNTRPSALAVSEAFDEGSRLGAWTLIGRLGEPNHIEIDRIKIHIFSDALASQNDSTYSALNKIGGTQLKEKIARARRESEKDSAGDPTFDKLRSSFKRLEHNDVFQRGLAATRDRTPDYSASVARPPRSSQIDWTKWGTIIGGLALIATIVIAVIH